MLEISSVLGVVAACCCCLTCSMRLRLDGCREGETEGGLRTGGSMPLPPLPAGIPATPGAWGSEMLRLKLSLRDSLLSATAELAPTLPQVLWLLWCRCCCCCCCRLCSLSMLSWLVLLRPTAALLQAGKRYGSVVGSVTEETGDTGGGGGSSICTDIDPYPPPPPPPPPSEWWWTQIRFQDVMDIRRRSPRIIEEN